MNPQELDDQNKILIEKWLDIDSEELRYKDQDRKFTRYCLKAGLKDGFLIVDSLGRVWLKSTDKYFPYHINVGKKNFGIRVAKKAAN